jgi:hypothetical protein
MLVTLDPQTTTASEQTPVGLAVMKWFVDGEPRLMVVAPFVSDTLSCCLVDILTHHSEYKVVTPATKEWRNLKKFGWGDNSEGYPLTRRISKDLYEVWDASDFTRPKQAEELYHFYKDLIEHFSRAANEYIGQVAEAQYQDAIKHAEAHGWDTEFITKFVPRFPYQLATGRNLHLKEPALSIKWRRGTSPQRRCRGAETATAGSPRARS